MKVVAERIKAARKAKGINQSALARLLGITPQAVQSWESGKSVPRNQNLQELCSALGVTAGHLFGDEEPNEVIAITDMPDEFVRVRIFEAKSLQVQDLRSSTVLGHQFFSATDLRARGIIASDLLCIHVEGNGMSPVLPHKTLVCFDLRDTEVVDGCVYAIEHMGQIRTKLVYSIPGGALRLSSYNKAEHQDEIYSASEITSQAIKVIGRVFWTSQFLG